jgi:hypothetical protein
MSHLLVRRGPANKYKLIQVLKIAKQVSKAEPLLTLPMLFEINWIYGMAALAAHF